MTEEEIRQYVKSNSQVNKAYMRRVYEEIDSLKRIMEIEYLPFSNWFDSYVKYEGMLYAGFIDKEFLKSYANRLISIAVSHGSPAEQLLYTSAISFIQNTLVLLEEPTVENSGFLTL